MSSHQMPVKNDDIFNRVISRVCDGVAELSNALSGAPKCSDIMSLAYKIHLDIESALMDRPQSDRVTDATFRGGVSRLQSQIAELSNVIDNSSRRFGEFLSKRLRQFVNAINLELNQALTHEVERETAR